MAYSPETYLLAAYVAAGPLAWGTFAFLLLNGRSHMQLLSRPPAPLPQGKTPPHVTILVPAKDEGERVRECIESLLAQDYPDFRVVAVNDRSTDDTGAIMDQIAAKNDKLTVVHIRDGELPPGWTGKCNALHRGVQHADGEYLLFVDSDVVVQPDALSATVSRALRHRTDLISLLPRLENHTFWERVLIPLAAGAVTTMFAVSLTNKDYLKHTAFANGQYLFFRRKAYDEIGGHERVRDKYCEDIEFARYMKPQGYKVRISWGADFAAVRMYRSLEQIFRGWGRIFFAGTLGKPRRIVLAIAFVLVSCYGAYVAAGWGAWRLTHPRGAGPDWHWAAAAATHLLVMHSVVAMLYAWTGNRKRSTLALPVGAAMLIGIFVRAIRMCATKRVEWRGTVYSNMSQQPPPAPIAAAAQK